MNKKFTILFKRLWGEKFGKTTTIEDKVELTAKSDPQELVEQWILEEDVYEVKMGNNLYQFEVPVNKRFAGFKEKLTKKPVEVKMVDHTERLEPNRKYLNTFKKDFKRIRGFFKAVEVFSTALKCVKRPFLRRDVGKILPILNCDIASQKRLFSSFLFFC
ncbi:MAG: hypothetical protein ACQEWT_00035 [Bacillota bacterium]